MLSRCWLEIKWIKHVAAQVGSSHPSDWNVTLYLQFKSSFFHPINNLPLQSFWVPIRPKVQKSSRLLDLERESRPRRLQHSTSHKFILTFLLQPLMEAAWSRITIPPTFVFFSADVSPSLSKKKNWLTRKSVTHPYQYKYWNILFLNFHHHSIRQIS